MPPYLMQLENKAQKHGLSYKVFPGERNRSVVQKYALCKIYTDMTICNAFLHRIFLLHYNRQAVCSHKLMFNFSFDTKND